MSGRNWEVLAEHVWTQLSIRELCKRVIVAQCYAAGGQEHTRARDFTNLHVSLGAIETVLLCLFLTEVVDLRGTNL